MIIKMQKGSKEQDVDKVMAKIKALGLEPDIFHGKEGINVIGVLGDTSRVPEDLLSSLEGVDQVIRIQSGYKLISREYNPDDRIVEVNGIKIGGKEKVIMAGPCSIENREQILRIANEVKNAGADILRGGAYKPRTSPYSYQGLGLPGLIYMAEAREKTGLPIITEATGPHNHMLNINGNKHLALEMEVAGKDKYVLENGKAIEKSMVLDNVLVYTDIIQIGARNMKAYGFLQQTAETTKVNKKPVLLKRGEEATIDEFLLAAEYLASKNPNIVLCLRGIRTFEEKKYQRYTSDIGAIPVIKKLSNLPVIFDPSHATGYREHVKAISLAAIAAGADGLLIECHYDPEHAMSDGRECIKPDVLESIVNKIK